MKRWVLAVPAVVLVSLIALLGYGLTRNPHVLPSALIGHTAPPFDLPVLGTSNRRLTTNAFKGRVVLVNVWASWCVACRSEVPVLGELSQRTGVPVVGLAYKDEADAARSWLNRFGDPFAVVALDRKGRTGIDWGISGVPETFVIDARGRIRYKVVGAVDEQVMQKTLLPLINRLQAST